MGAYLNSQTPYTLYQSESRSPYFVDKTTVSYTHLTLPTT